MTAALNAIEASAPSVLTPVQVLPARDAVAISLGLASSPEPADQGLIPLRLHEALRGKPTGSMGAGEIRVFRAGQREFWWLGPAAREGLDGAADLDSAVDLTGHHIVWPTHDLAQGVSGALDLIATRPWAMSLVATFITTFAMATTPDGVRGRITSCSLPDFPLCVFLSDRAFVHIPPLSVSTTGSIRLVAENIYHEAVHQSVNHQLLTRPIFLPGYSSATSPKIPIYWRTSAGNETRNRAWELDRVLHAAAVYCHLLHWRYAELADPKTDPEHRRFVAEATRESLGALAILCEALTEHIGHFTAEGALMVGRLVEASRQRSALLDATLEHSSGSAGLKA
ncbi:hypothetical protein [Streptomyces sp. NBC_00258]|uniref:hypothetical protein n=1 Tax=Streptomyces sp. NBC_00258 TaxID=2903642 RepID=UPI002E27EFCC|nr:hypothetical protein [Streptomyces sp. NBC_00258]